MPLITCPIVCIAPLKNFLKGEGGCSKVYNINICMCSCAPVALSHRGMCSVLQSLICSVDRVKYLRICSSVSAAGDR